MGRVHVSLPWATILEPPPAVEGLTWSRRPVDWGLSRIQSRLQHVGGGLRVLWEGRNADTIILCHAGMDVVVAGLAHRLLARRSNLMAVDFLLPPKTPRSLLRLALRGVDEAVVIRSGDIKVLTRLGMRNDRCRFVRFAAPTRALEEQIEIGDHVYSGGFAQRDWATLAEALHRAGVPAIVSCPDEAQAFSRNVEKRGLVDPEEGRELLRRSRFLVQAIMDNEQPSGPLLILDAFSSGKPVVASDVNGTRDYVVDGVNGVVVPPGDATSLARAIADLFGDPDRIRHLSAGARDTARRLTSAEFWTEVLRMRVERPRQGGIT
jgi:hypothetical protein